MGCAGSYLTLPGAQGWDCSLPAWPCPADCLGFACSQRCHILKMLLWQKHGIVPAQPQQELDSQRGQLQLFQPSTSRSHRTVPSQPSPSRGWCWRWLAPRKWSCVWPSSHPCPTTTGSQPACPQLLPACCWSEGKAAGRGFSPCGFPGKAGSSPKDKAASRSPSWGCARRSGGAGGGAGTGTGTAAKKQSRSRA